MGHRVPLDFWTWNRCGDDADHAVIALPFAFSMRHFTRLNSRAGDGFRICKRRV